MATIRTTKRLQVQHLFELLGQAADISTTPRVVGTQTVVVGEDEDGNPVEEQWPVLEGVPLDAPGEKEVTATNRGDGTPITAADLEAAVAEAERRTYDGVLEADRQVILANGVDEARVTSWLYGQPGPVAFTVNGQVVDVPVVDNAAELAVTAAQVGPVEVTAQARTLILQAEEA